MSLINTKLTKFLFEIIVIAMFYDNIIAEFVTI